MLSAAGALLLLAVTLSSARLVNITIDDTYGDPLTGVKPQYVPDGFMADTGPLQSEHWDWSQIYNGTLHVSHVDETTVQGNVSMSFNGTRIYAFFVVMEVVQMALTFFLDGSDIPSGNYTRPGKSEVPDSDVWMYNQMLFDSGPLPHGEHSLLVHADIPVIAFDYAIYTTEEDDAVDRDGGGNTRRAHHRFIVGAIVGASLGAVVLASFASWVFIRRRRARPAPRPPALRAERLTPFYALAEPETTPSFSPKGDPFADSEKSGRRPYSSADRMSPSWDHETLVGSATPAVEGDEPRNSLVAGDASPRSENTAYFRAELQRVIVERDRVIAENDLLRRAVDPPRYSDGSR